jgi:ABC-type transport system involved in cytochrome bd biosynthesis fused ATPase/permease subunit
LTILNTLKGEKSRKLKMAKVMNIVFGIGIAIAIFVLVLTGVGVFYPGPDWTDNNCTEPEMVKLQICNPDMTVGDCYDVVAGKQLNETNTQEKFDECNKAFEKEMENYDKDMLVINYIIGLIVLIIALLLVIYLPSMVNISVGSNSAGLALIFYGFIRGWESTSDKIKFFLALVIAIVIIIFAVIINRRYNKKK